MAPAEFPTEGVVLTHLYVVGDLDRSRHFYRDVLGASVYREYEGTSCVLSFQGSWLLLVTEGGPTKDKPTVTFAPPNDPNKISHELTLRVPDCQAAYETLKARGTEFLTPPLIGAAKSVVSFATQMATFWRSVRPSSPLKNRGT